MLANLPCQAEPRDLFLLSPRMCVGIDDKVHELQQIPHRKKVHHVVIDAANYNLNERILVGLGMSP